MSDPNFQPIFDYIDEGLKKQDERIEQIVEAKLVNVQTSIANLSAQVKQYHEETMVSGHRIDRLEDWAKQVGQKVGVPISF